MYLRKTQRRNRDGSVVRYVQLANNRRMNGTTQAEVLVNLGREDHLDLDALRRFPHDRAATDSRRAVVLHPVVKCIAADSVLLVFP